jgi:exonuclease SbcD
LERRCLRDAEHPKRIPVERSSLKGADNQCPGETLAQANPLGEVEVATRPPGDSAKDGNLVGVGFLELILHCSDLHLDASFASGGIPASAGAWRRADLRATLGRILTLARERQVDAVTIAGDLYEQDYVLPDTADFLAQQFARLLPVRVFIAPGERDALTSDSLYSLTRWPGNVKIFSQGQLSPEPLVRGLTLWGAACPPPRGDRALKGFNVQGDGTHLLLLHAAVTGQREAEPGVFLVDATAVQKAGFSFALLGHCHSARMWPEDAPCCAYPGSPEPLGRDEAQGTHEVVLLSIGERGCQTERFPIGQWRYTHLQVDLTSCQSVSEATLRVRQGIEAKPGDNAESVTFDVSLTGRLEFDLSLAELAAQIETRAAVQYELGLSIPYDLDRLAQEETVRGLLARRFQKRLAGAISSEDRLLSQDALFSALRALERKQVNPDEIH